jgi:hypothetical protein
LILELYKKFNPGLNDQTELEFLQKAQHEHEQSLLSLNYFSGFHVDTSKLFTENLDQTLYKHLVDYCGLDNNYNEAAVIHKIWFNLHLRKQFVQNSLTNIHVCNTIDT